MQFITECFHIGYEHCTIAGFRSTISAYHDPINGVAVAKKSRVTALLACVYNIRPPQPRYTFIWDVKKVIDFLVTLDSPNKLGFKDLTIKLTMLLALKSASRVLETGFLGTKYLVKKGI